MRSARGPLLLLLGVAFALWGSVLGRFICMHPPYHGPCNDKIQRWYFDRRARDCKTFTFGGCQANDNNFETQSMCRAMCIGAGSAGRSNRRKRVMDLLGTLSILWDSKSPDPPVSGA